MRSRASWLDGSSNVRRHCVGDALHRNAEHGSAPWERGPVPWMEPVVMAGAHLPWDPLLVRIVPPAG